MSSGSRKTVGIIGAGTMGAGIAQVASMHGWDVYLHDVDAAIVERAIDGIEGRFERLVEKGRMTAEGAAEARERLRIALAIESLRDCSLIIEAIVEDLNVKGRVLQDILRHLDPDAVIASNTSSLSITKLGESIGESRRTVGMHFFNPAPIMQLVEVIAGDETDPDIVDDVAEIAASWGKKVARAADVPGFIVNHVARPYYLEAFRLLEDGYAAPDQIDDVMNSLGGFRMGPFELTDLIGQDVNTATTRSVWEQLDKPPLLAPSRVQEQLVTDGNLGRKTGRGAYIYENNRRRPAIEIDAKPLPESAGLRHMASDLTSRALGTSGSDIENYVFARVLVAIIVQAHLAQERGVASSGDIDLAMKYGVNYPKGPFEWTQQVGPATVNGLLEALNTTVDDNRFAVPESLLIDS